MKNIEHKILKKCTNLIKNRNLYLNIIFVQ